MAKLAAPLLAMMPSLRNEYLPAFVMVDGFTPYDDERIGALMRLGAKWVPCDWCSRAVIVDSNDGCSNMIDLDPNTMLEVDRNGPSLPGFIKNSTYYGRAGKLRTKPRSEWTETEIESAAARYCSAMCMTHDNGNKNPGQISDDGPIRFIDTIRFPPRV